MMVENSAHVLSPPGNPILHLEDLRKAFLHGDIIALIQAAAFAHDQAIAIPDWAHQSLEDTLVGVLTQRRGHKGKGNSAFGQFRKRLIRTVRASSYLYVRAWQKDPHCYHDLPVQTFQFWRTEKTLWHSHRSAGDAARLASTSLHGTEFVANASTVRRAANRFPVPIKWGRAEAEAKLGLRGPSGIFGPMPKRLEPHIASLLA